MPWQKQFNVEAALQKAMRTFWSYGYDATSMQDLVQCMGINRGSLYDTYGDKRELFLAALRYYDQEYRKARLTRLERSYSPREAIREFFHGQVRDALRDEECCGCFLTNTALELAAHDEEIGKIVTSGQADLERFFRRMIERGQAKKEISLRVDPLHASRALLGLALGLLVLSRSRPEKALLQSIANEAMAMVA